MPDPHDPLPASPDPFPTHALPPVLREMAEKVEKAVGGGHDLPGIVALGAASLVTAPGLQVAPSTGSLRTPALLFIMAAAVSGSGKSRTAKYFIDVILRREREIQERFRSKIRPGLLAEKDRLAAELAMCNDETRRRLRGKGADQAGQPDDSADARAAELHARLEAIEQELRCPQLVVEDFTSSALVRTMADNGGRCMIFSSDARAAIKNLLGRHQKDGADDATQLKIWSAESMSISRRGTGPGVEQINIARLTASLLHMVQPDLAHEVMSNKSLMDSGYMCRTLVAITDSMPALPEDRREVPPETIRRYEDRLCEVMDAYYFPEEPATAYLSEESERMLDDRERAAVLDYRGGKRDGWPIRCRDIEQVMRISGVFHAFLHGRVAHELRIEAATVSGAMEVMDWFGRQRQPLIDSQQVERDNQVRSVVSALAEAHPRGFTIRDAQRRNIIPGQGTAAEVQALLEDLVKRGILVSTIDKATGRTDRPLYLSAKG